MNIVVVDDHTLIRAGLRNIIAQRPGWSVVGEASSADDVLAILRRQPVDVVVLDITLDGRSGLDVVESIRSEFPAVRTLMLSMHDEKHYAVHAMRSGASGYIQKDASPGEVLHAIELVSSGHSDVSAAVADHLVSIVARTAPAVPHERLSAREFEVFRLIGAGRSVGEIASALHLSPKTVSTYRSRILQKTGFGSSAEIVRYVVRSGLV